MSSASAILIESFFDPTTSTDGYTLVDTGNRDCALIDSGRCHVADLMMRISKDSRVSEHGGQSLGNAV